MDIGSTKSDKRYEVVVKHYSAGVLHMASFKTRNQAHAFLMARWNGLPTDSGRTQIECGAAIYDRHRSRRRLFTLGTAYLVDEDRGKNRQ
jgi:hypothetical protein